MALRYPDGSYDILYDGPVNDNMSFYGWHNSYEEAIYDWYVGEEAMDLPLYVQDWGDRITYPEGTEPGSYPVHRYDGDGWYLYLPVEGWTQWIAGDTNWFWTSDYCSGFTLTVEYITTNLADYLAGETQGMTPADDSGRVFTAQWDGWVYRDCYVDAVDGGCWKISTKWFDPDRTDSTSAVSPAPGPMAPIHRQALALMAESFTPDNRITPTQTSASLLTGVTAGETPLTLTLLPEDGQAGDGLGDCWSCGNSRYFYSELAALTWRAYSAPAGEAPKGAGVTLTGPGWTITAYEGYPAAAFDDGSGAVWLKPDGAEEVSPYQLLRGWYDEVEFHALGGGFDGTAPAVIPDSGQDYLAAAQAFCSQVEERHLQASSGGSFRWNYVQCQVKPEEEQIPALADLPDNVHPFRLTTIFVPENETALAHASAGGTERYAGSDPSLPEGAYEYGLCGYMTMETNGWHGNIVGAGW